MKNNKEIIYKGQKYKLFTEETHIKKHTKKENTFCNKCLFCVFSNYEAKKILKGFQYDKK